MSWASAQSIKITGTVTSYGNEIPLNNVFVHLKGTEIYTITNDLGQYEISANKSGILVFQYPGTITKEVDIANQSEINITLTFEDNLLDEAIVVGYTTTNKISFTGSAIAVRKDVIEKSQASSISKVLQGNVAGLQSNSLSGQPGTNATLLIRGISSANASIIPLYVVDGVSYSGDINAINPDDVESITVLKDAAAGAIYGSRGANGVIIITTKRGKKGQTPKVDIKLRYGFSDRAVSEYEQVSTNEYFALSWEALYNQNKYINGYSAVDAAHLATNNLVSALKINPYGPQLFKSYKY